MTTDQFDTSMNEGESMDTDQNTETTEQTAPINGQENDPREYSLDELSEAAGVTPRTVRYYIVEGLLPPPISAGRNATYSQEHLDRLLAIAMLKDMFLPLREIKRQLEMLTPEQLRDPEYLASIAREFLMERAQDRRGRHGGHGRHRGRGPVDFERGEFPGGDGPFRGGPFGERGERPHREHRRGRPERDFGPQRWDRISLGDDAELHIRSRRAETMGPELFAVVMRLRHLFEEEDGRRPGI